VGSACYSDEVCHFQAGDFELHLKEECSARVFIEGTGSLVEHVEDGRRGGVDDGRRSGVDRGGGGGSKNNSNNDNNNIQSM